LVEVKIIESPGDLEPQFANARDYWLGYGRADRSGGDFALYRSGVSDPQLNGVLKVGRGSAEDAVTEARRRLDGVPWMWWVGPDSDPGLVDRLLAAGASENAATPAMAVRLDQVVAVDRPPGLKVEEVTGPAALAEWVGAYGPSFGVAPAYMADVVRLEESRPDVAGSLVRFAGRLNGKLAGTSALFDRHGVAGVYVVTTAEGHRRSGIGTILTAAALQAGRERGLRIGTLQATPDGLPLYRRMGFAVVSHYRIFTLPGEPART
jgi:ribosomal protein S18 acetylase RimI-like enzyme